MLIQVANGGLIIPIFFGFHVFFQTRLFNKIYRKALRIRMRLNFGGPARDIDFAKMKDDFSIKEGFTKFKQAPLVKEGIKELAPNQEMPLAWLSIPTVSEINRSVKIKFEYKNLAGKSKAGLNFIDFHALINSLG